MEKFVYCQINEPEFGSSTSCAVRLDDNAMIVDFVDSSTHNTNYVWDINFPPREKLIGKSFDDLKELCNDACEMEEGSYRTPYLDTEEISKEDFMGYKLHSLTNDAKWFSHDGSTLSQSFLNEYNQAIPELKEFCNEEEFDGLQQIVAGLKIRDMKRTQSSNEEKTEDPNEEKAKIITKGDRRISNPNKPRIKRVTPAVNREEIKQQNALNHYNNLRKYYGK